MSKAGYQRLEGRIERAYKRKGYSTKRASYIAHAAAGEVAREKRTRRNPSPPRNADGTFKRQTTRRNPARKAPPSHDLFGERSHKLDMFGGKTYQAVPKAKKSAAERKAQQKRNAGQGSFDFGMTRGLFG